MNQGIDAIAFIGGPPSLLDIYRNGIRAAIKATNAYLIGIYVIFKIVGSYIDNRLGGFRDALENKDEGKGVYLEGTVGFEWGFGRFKIPYFHPYWSYVVATCCYSGGNSNKGH